MRLDLYLEKNILPTEEQIKNLREQGSGNYHQQIRDTVASLSGEQLLKEYKETLENYNFIKSREVFATLLEHGDFEKIIPYLLSSEQNKKNFGSFLKIAFNESQKNKNSQTKKYLKLIQNIINNLNKMAKNDHTYEDLLRDFYINDVIHGGF